MSFASAIRDSRFSGLHDYQPVSDGSRAMRRAWGQGINYLQGSASDWFPTVDAAFLGIRSECMNENWDGHGATAVTETTIKIAEKVVQALFALAKRAPAPDVLPEADGEICISWTLDAAWVFSLSVGEHGIVNVAGQFGRKGGVHAWQQIDLGDRGALEESLRDVATYVERLYPPTVSRRAA